MRPALSIDLETFSSVDLLKQGAHRYMDSPDFEIDIMSYCFYDDDDIPEDPKVITLDLLSGDTIPKDVLEALYDPKILKTAYNASFERGAFTAALEARTDPSQWSCTQMMARELGLPPALGDTGKVLGLKSDKVKDKEGKALIQYFAKPCTPTITNDFRFRNMPEDNPERWKKYLGYNKQDVVSELAIRRILKKFKILDSEFALWHMDQDINDRGVYLDLSFAHNADEAATVFKTELANEMKAITGLPKPTSVEPLKDWIASKEGWRPDSLDKKVIKEVMRKVKDPDVKQVLELRAMYNKTSVAKFAAMLRTVCKDNRIRGLSLFCGASRTARWAGRNVQMQNLPQNKMPPEDLDTARVCIANKDLESFEMLFDKPMMALSELVRTAFIPKPGCSFVVADFSAIEARVIAWLSNETWRQELFAEGGAIYEASAEQMFNLPRGSVKKGDPMRQKGKIAELALGFGGAKGALAKMGALDMGLTEEELPGLVKLWRAANKNIVNFWWEVDRLVRHTIMTKERSRSENGMIALRREGPLLRLRLPSGRELSYVKPRIQPGTFNGKPSEDITYEGIIQDSGGWGRIESYGPKFVENIVQATARDCLAAAMLKVEKAGFPIVFHVHDELIAEVPTPEAENVLEQVKDIMAEKLPWADGLLLTADAYICQYYKKD